MRIAIVQAGLSAGGTERVVSLLAGDRCKRGDEVHVFAFVQADEESYFPLHPDAVVHRLVENDASRFLRIGFIRSFKRVLMLRAEFKRLHPDLVASFLTKINILSVIATRRLSIPVIISERNNPDVQERHWLWKVVSAFILRQADALVMQTMAITQTLPAALRAKAFVIGNPCQLLERNGEPSRARRVVAVGRLVGQKGFDILIEAFGKLAADFPGWSMTIYGEGPDRVDLQNQITSSMLEDRVHMPGVTERAGDWIHDASIFVLSSRYEGFPNVLVEAMAAGLPVISTDCDFGPSEIIDANVTGLLVPVDDVHRLAAAMRQLMQDEALRCEIAEQGQKITSRFANEVIMGKWDACFHNVHRRRMARRARKGMRFGSWWQALR